ncbi:MAG TPA: hypothetical protein DDZ67_09040 [Xanthomonadaceae bacterium]|nr:hypothetical protein [Xanthomonadaceae bacterium]
MEPSAIRRAAIVLAAMQPPVRVRLLATLDPAMRAELGSAMQEAMQRGWNTRSLALRMLDPTQAEAEPQGDQGLPAVFALADHLEPAAFARVLQATGMRSDDFRLSMIDDAGAAARVREEMMDAPAMSARLREATLAAANSMLDDLRSAG